MYYSRKEYTKYFTHIVSCVYGIMLTDITDHHRINRLEKSKQISTKCGIDGRGDKSHCLFFCHFHSLKERTCVCCVMF